MLAQLVPVPAALVPSPAVAPAGASPVTEGNQQRHLLEGGFDCRSEMEVFQSLLGSHWLCTQLRKHGVFFLETNQLSWLTPLSPRHQNPPRLSQAVTCGDACHYFLPSHAGARSRHVLPAGKLWQSAAEPRWCAGTCPAWAATLPPSSALGIPLMRLLPAAITFYGSQPETN